MMKIEANDTHKLHISVTLRLLEKALIDVGRAAIEPPPETRLIRHSDPISPAVSAEILATAAEARGEIAAIAAELELPQHEESIVRTLLGNLHVRVVSVAELQPRFLCAGGAVPPALAEYIGPKADRLETLVRRLIGLLESQFQEEHQ
jgi:hypothetical protein